MVCKRPSGEAGAPTPELNLGNLFAMQQSSAAAIFDAGARRPPDPELY
jgi:hypothetical protein